MTDPFDADAGSPYALDEWATGNELSTQADRTYQDAVATDDKGDRFDLAAVFLALALFFGGIATIFRRHTAQLVNLGVGSLGFVIGLVAVVWAHLA